MKSIIFVLLISIAAVIGTVIPPNKFASACSEIPSNTSPTGCTLDLTIAIDMSSAMENTANIATLTNNILSNFLPSFNLNETNTAGIAFGASTIGVSDYFNNSADFCQWLHSSEEQATQVGLGYANLSAVFQDYQTNLFHSGRNYKKVFALFTAINDTKEILNAKTYTDTLRSYGVYIIVGALGPAAHSSSIYELGDFVFYSDNYTIPSFNITSEICQFGGVTIFPSQNSTPSNPTSGTTDPRSNAIGTECSTNVANAWLDIVFVIDTSAAMHTEDLRQLAAATAGYMSRLNIAQFGNHTTRAAIITYAKDPTVRYNLIDVTNIRDLEIAFKKLVGYYDPTDNFNDVQKALQSAYSLLQSQTSSRVKTIILNAAAYNPSGFDGAEKTATIIKENGISIFTVSFDSSAGVNTNLEAISSPGYAYIAQDSDIYHSIPYGLTQVNCFCPEGSLQFRSYDIVSRNYTTYADCIWGAAVETLPSIVSLFGCDPGVMASVTSQEKLDFITDNILPHDLKGKKQFTVGGHKSGTQWMWYGYDSTEYPIGNFPSLTQNSPDDQYTYFQKCPGFCFNFQSGGDIPRPYLCESKACDADNICDQTPLK